MPRFTAAGGLFGLLFATGIAVFGRTRFVGGLLRWGWVLLPALAHAFVAYVAAGLILMLLVLGLDALELVPYESLRPTFVVPLASGVVAVVAFIAALKRGRASRTLS